MRPLHGGQTSQGKCARVAPAFDPVNDIHESHGGVAGVSEVEICPNFPTILPRIVEKNYPQSVTHGAPVIWVSCGGVGCQLSTRGVSGRLPTSKT